MYVETKCVGEIELNVKLWVFCGCFALARYQHIPCHCRIESIYTWMNMGLWHFTRTQFAHINSHNRTIKTMPMHIHSVCVCVSLYGSYGMEHSTITNSSTEWKINNKRISIIEFARGARCIACFCFLSLLRSLSHPFTAQYLSICQYSLRSDAWITAIPVVRYLSNGSK